MTLQHKRVKPLQAHEPLTLADRIEQIDHLTGRLDGMVARLDFFRNRKYAFPAHVLTSPDVEHADEDLYQLGLEIDGLLGRGCTALGQAAQRMAIWLEYARERQQRESSQEAQDTTATE